MEVGKFVSNLSVIEIIFLHKCNIQLVKPFQSLARDMHGLLHIP